MAQTSWPFENIDTSETQFSLWARNLGQGVISDKLNELESDADGSGMIVKVKSGQALVRGHFYENTDEVTLTIEAADLTNPRLDAVVLRLDPTANSILLTVIEGTPDASPSLPALTQTDGGVYDLLIASVTVPAAAVVIAAENVDDERILFTAWSGQLPNAQVTTKTVNYTLAPGDNQNLLQVNGTYTLTVPSNIFATGSRVDVANIGTGTVTFAAGAGMTLNSKDSMLTIETQYSAATVFFTSATTGLLVGDLA